MAQQVELRDEHGNPVELTDAFGNPVWLTDEKGNPVRLTGVATIVDQPLQTPQHVPLHSNSTSVFFEDKGFEDEGHVRMKKEKMDRTTEKSATEEGEEEMKEHSLSETSPKEKLEEEVKVEEEEEEELEEEEEEKEKKKEHYSHTKTCRINIDEHRNTSSTRKGIIEMIKERLPGQGNH